MLIRDFRMNEGNMQNVDNTQDIMLNEENKQRGSHILKDVQDVNMHNMNIQNVNTPNVNTRNLGIIHDVHNTQHMHRVHNAQNMHKTKMCTIHRICVK